MRRQALRYGAAGVAGIVLAAVLVVMVNWLGARTYHRADWTRSQVYSLSPKTRGILGGLEQEIRVVVFMTPASNLYPQVSELLSRYAAASDRVKVEYIDPDREPLKTRQLAEEFGISAANTVVLSYGERSKYVTSDQMVEYDFAGMQFGQQPTIRAFKGEAELTSAILSLVAPGVPKIYFVTGHGEASVTSAAPTGALSDRSLAVLGEVLKRDNLEVADTSLLAGRVPEDADVLAVVGPTQPFTELEVSALGAFLDRGGRLLVALDPLIDASGVMRSTRIEELLAERGAVIGDDLVVDPSRKLPFYDLSAVYLTDLVSHPVTRGLEGVAVLFTVARSVTAEGAAATALIETTAEGWGETDLAALLAGRPVVKDDSDTPGPVSVAVAVEGEATPLEPGGDVETDGEAPIWRLVVFGDSDFMSDLEISNAGNAALASNAFSWLTDRDETIGIPPRAVEQVSLFLTQQQLSTILLITLVLMPGAAIVAGIVVWRRRRH